MTHMHLSPTHTEVVEKHDTVYHEPVHHETIVHHEPVHHEIVHHEPVHHEYLTHYDVHPDVEYHADHETHHELDHAFDDAHDVTPVEYHDHRVLKSFDHPDSHDWDHTHHTPVRHEAEFHHVTGDASETSYYDTFDLSTE